MTESVLRKPPVWGAGLIAAAILFSFALACGMPFAALGAVAALTLPPRDAMLLAGAGWLANQAIGFGYLGYPLDAMTMAWGVALGASALAAVCGAVLAMRHAVGAHAMIGPAVAFLAAWGAQQGVVFLASLILGGMASALAPSVVWFILWTNALAFVSLIALQIVGARVGLATPLSGQAAG